MRPVHSACCHTGGSAERFCHRSVDMPNITKSSQLPDTFKAPNKVYHGPTSNLAVRHESEAKTMLVYALVEADSPTSEAQDSSPHHIRT